MSAHHCPGRKSPFLAVKRHARPYKSAIQTRFTMGNAKGFEPPRAVPDRDGRVVGRCMVARVVRAVGAAERPDSRDTQGLGAGLPARIINTIRLGVGAARDLVLLRVGGAARRRFYPNA